MGEEEKKPAAEEVKKPEEPKKVEEKKEEKPAEKPAAEEKKDEKKTEETKDKAPPPPQEIVLKVYMHCEGCARKIHRCLRGFEGVEDVTTDCKASKVVVKGEKADPLKVLERVQRKSHRQVVLISPIPKPPSEEEKKAEEKEKPKVEQKKEEPPVIRVVVLRVSMHCEACAMEIKKRIQRMKGVESAEPDLKSSEVTVKGVFEPQQLVEYVHKRTGKHAVIVKQEPEKKEDEKGKESKEDKKGGGDKQNKGGDGGAGEQGENKDKKEGGGGDNEAKAEAKAATVAAEETTEETTVTELRKMDFYNYYTPTIYEYCAPPPQIFSDENPNACSVM